MQSNYPHKSSIGEILKRAYFYWLSTILYQVLFSILSLSILVTSFIVFGEKYGILNHYMGLSEKLKEGFDAYEMGIKEMILSPGFMTFYWIMIATFVFIFPLNLGLYKMYRGIDLGIKPRLQDLFAGYEGVNFFIYTGFYLFWLLIYLYTVPTGIFAIVWVLLTLFTAPLMFFMDKRIFQTIPLNFKALKHYPLEIISACIVAFLFKYLGIFTVIGAIFTYPFWTAMIYSLYQRIFTENN